MESNLENLTIEELQKKIKENDEKRAQIRKEGEENIGILDEKIKESREETDKALLAAKEILLQSISERRERIAELKQQNVSLDEKTQQTNGETISFLTEIVDKLKVNSITDVPAEIDKLKKLEKEVEKLKNQIQIYQKGEILDTNQLQIQEKIEDILRIWDFDNLKLPQDSSLNGMFNILRDWLNSMKQDNFEQSNTFSNDFINEIESIINVK